MHLACHPCWDSAWSGPTGKDDGVRFATIKTDSGERLALAAADGTIRCNAGPAGDASSLLALLRLGPDAL